MTINEARLGIGLTVRPVWATTTAHWILSKVLEDGTARIRTKRGKFRVERLVDIQWTGEASRRIASRRRQAREGVSDERGDLDLEVSDAVG